MMRYSLKSIPINISRWLIILIFLVLLELIVRFGIISRLFVALPSKAFVQMFTDIFSGKLVGSTMITMYELAIAFLLSAIVGVAMGYFFWRFPHVGDAYDPLISGFFSSPVILLYPIFLVIFGRSTLAVISLAVVVGVLPIILFTRQGFSGVNPTLLKVGASMNLPRRAVFRHILVPAAAPTIFTGLRLGLTYILIYVISVEFIVEVGGLGKVIAGNYLRFRITELYAAIACVILLSVAFLFLTYHGERMVRK